MSARAEDAARALSREQPTTADAAVPAPANNGSADAEGVEIPAPEPSGNKNLLRVQLQRDARRLGLVRRAVLPQARAAGAVRGMQAKQVSPIGPLEDP